MADVDLTAGWTGVLPFQLLVTPPGATSTAGPLDLSSKSVELILRDKNRAQVPINTTTMAGSELIILSSTAGLVAWNPSSTNDLSDRRAPYTGRFRVVDGAGKIVYCPSGPPDTWQVHAA